MKGTVEPFVLIPRYTSYVGENKEDGGVDNSFATVPLDVSAFSKAVLTFWRGPLLGGPGAAFSAQFESSHDGVTWFPEGAAITSTDTSDKHDIDLDRRWFRVRIELTENPTNETVGITCWATGNLEQRLR